MVTTLETKRLNAIKRTYVIFEKKCDHCGKYIKLEMMWYVDRTSPNINRSGRRWYYCQNCMHSEKDVLHEIDTDNYAGGILFLDEHRNFKKVSKPAYTPPPTKRQK